MGLLTEYTDTVGMALLAQGSDPSAATVASVDSAVDLLAEQTQAGRFAGYYGNDFIDALAAGEVVACLAWSGDVLQAQLDNPYLKFVIPEEGLMIWSDSLLVPAASSQADAVAGWPPTSTTRSSRRRWPPGSTTSAPWSEPRRRWSGSTPTSP